jgi:CubicO group peptidase (beta-lactamase class C family)
MIFQLVEGGKIELTNTLDAWYPEIPNAKVITIGNLLNHRSGIHSFTDDPDYTTYMTQPKTHEEMIALMAKGKPEFQPGEKAAYSNSNYVLLGYIVEKVTKQPYAKNLAERITAKAGLSNTSFGGKINLNDNDCYSYRFDGSWKEQPVTDMSIPGGAGSIVSTPTDLTKFIEALFSFKLVSKGSLDQMKTITDGYGMGMFQIPFGTKKAFGHNGGIDGFRSNLAYFPEDGLAIAYCTNGMVYPMNDLLIGVLSIYFNKDFALPTFKTIAVKSEELDKYLGVYASSQLPLKITVTKVNEALSAQATGQSAFPLTAFEKDKFKFDQAGIVMEFNPDKNEFLLKQGGGVFTFTKEK